MDMRIISGFLGRDAEKIANKNGNEFWKTSIGVKNYTETKWVDVIIPDNGQKRNEYLRKGKVIEAWGRPDYRTWTDRNNDTRVQEVIWVADWRLGDTPRSEEERAAEEPAPAAPRTRKAETKADDYQPTDLPF